MTEQKLFCCNYGIFAIVRNKISEQKSHAKKIGSLENQTAEIWAFEVHISPY